MNKAIWFTISFTDNSQRQTGFAWGRWVACVLLCGWGWLQPALAEPPPSTQVTLLERPPRLQPDYRDLILPPNVAPLNFRLQEDGSSFYVTLRAKAGAPIEVQSKSPTIAFPEAAWHRLLDLNQGGELRVDVYARATDGPWRHFTTVTNHIATEDIDPFLIYRKIHPVHGNWSTMGIYQRDLRTFTETPILENRRFADDCCHCHALRNNDPNTMTVDIRSTHYENRLVVISNGVVAALRGTVGFVAWHPTGQVIVSSFNKPRLLYHTARKEARDVVELEGWLGYFRLGSNIVRRIPGLVDESRLMTFPAWAPDGRYLYYCSAPNPWTNMARVTPTSPTLAQYDLMRIPYDLERDQWGKPETVLPVSQTGFSVAQPRISPDGHWLFFCAIPYGCWPTYEPDSDLYRIDLRAGAAAGHFTSRKLELNSDQTESLLSWSSNSRWVVFSSKRISPLFNRPFLAHVAADGACSRPFLLPQADPQFYDGLLLTYTLPTLAKGPVPVPERALVAAIKDMSRPALVMPAAKAPMKEDPQLEGH
jgi:hypothetical protein